MKPAIRIWFVGEPSGVVVRGDRRDKVHGRAGERTRVPVTFRIIEAFSPVPLDWVMTELPPTRLMFPSVSVETTPGVVLPVR